MGVSTGWWSAVVAVVVVVAVLAEQLAVAIPPGAVGVPAATIVEVELAARAQVKE